jgi:plastocyanin
LAAGEGLSYDKKTLSAKAGAVSIAFSNAGALAHNVTVESSSGEQLGATETFAGGSKTLKLTLKAGTYKFFCSVPGHRQGGMEGTLTVQ